MTPREGDPVALTRALVAIPSVNPDLEPGGAGEREIGEWCAELLRDWGFGVSLSETAPGRTNVIARLGDAGPTLLLQGHLDTVGVEGMEGDPFDPRIVGGRIHGRGSCDMKAGLAATLAVARRVARETPSRGELVVAFTSDEEYASIGLQHLLDGGLTADAAIVCEPTSLALLPANKGFAWFELLFRGRAAHGSRPDLGVDAIRHAGRFLSALDSLESDLLARKPHALLGHASLHAGTISGGTAPPVYPAECRLTMERRLLPGEELPDVEAELREAVERAGRGVSDWSVELSRGLTRKASEIDPSHPLVERLLKAIDAEGVPPRVEGMTAWVETAFLTESGIPAVCFGPGSLAQAHTAEEWVEISEIEAAARILEAFTREFLATGLEQG